VAEQLEDEAEDDLAEGAALHHAAPTPYRHPRPEEGGAAKEVEEVAEVADARHSGGGGGLPQWRCAETK
jgi:hypothetical protein